MSSSRKRRGQESVKTETNAETSRVSKAVAPNTPVSKNPSASSKKKESEAEKKRRLDELKRTLNIPASAYPAASNASVERPAAKPSEQAPQQKALPGKAGKAALAANAAASRTTKFSAAGANANANNRASSGSSSTTKQTQNETVTARNAVSLRTGKLVRPSDSDEDDDDGNIYNSAKEKQMQHNQGNGARPLSKATEKPTPASGVPQPQATDELDSSFTRKRKRPSLFHPESSSSSLDSGAKDPHREVLTARRVVSPKQEKKTSVPSASVPNTAQQNKKPQAAAQLGAQTSRFSLPKAQHTTPNVEHNAQRTNFAQKPSMGTQLIGVDEVRRIEEQRRPAGAGVGEHRGTNNWPHNEQSASTPFSFSTYHIPKRVRTDNLVTGHEDTVKPKAALHNNADRRNDSEEMDTAEISDIDDHVTPTAPAWRVGAVGRFDAAAVRTPVGTATKPNETLATLNSRRIVYIVPDTNALMSDSQLFDRIFECTERAESNLNSSTFAPAPAPAMVPQIEVNATTAEFRFVLPWIVIQELDKLKCKSAWPGGNGSAPESAIAKMENGMRMYRARQAIRLVNAALRRGGTLRGQSAPEKDAAASAFQFDAGANHSTNDDRILQCCLQLRANCQRDRQCAVYLYTYDLNLANKALVSTVGCVDRNSIRTLLRDGFTPEMNRAFANAQSLIQPGIQTSVTPVTGPSQRTLVPPPVSVPTAPSVPESKPRTVPTPAPVHAHAVAPPVASTNTYALSAAREHHDTDMRNVEVRQAPVAARVPERHNLLYPDLGAFKNAEQAREQSNGKLAEELLRLFSAVLETEMRAEYADWWLEVVLIRPPWHSILDLLVCFNKHWIAVFSRVFGRASAAAFADVHKHAKALKLADDAQLVASLRDNGQLDALRQILRALAARSKPYAAHAEALLSQLGGGIDSTDFNPAPSVRVETTSSAAASVIRSQPALANESAAQEPPAVSPALRDVLSCLEALWQHINSEKVTLSASASRGDAETRAQLGSVYAFLRTLLDVLNFWHTTDTSSMIACDSSSNFMRSLFVFIELIHTICLDGSTASHFSVDAVREFASSKHYISEALNAFGSLLHQLQALLGRTNGDNDLTDLDMDVADIS